MDPCDVLGDLRVDAVLALPGAPFAPAHYACHEPCAFVACHMRPAAIALTRVLLLLIVSGTEHAVGDLKRAGLDAFGAVDVWHGQLLQDGGLEATLTHSAEAAHHAVLLEHQHTLGEVALRKASGDDESVESDGLAELDEGDVVVVGLSHVVHVNQNLVYVVHDLTTLVDQRVELT